MLVLRKHYVETQALKKILLMLLVVCFFLVGCAPKEVNEDIYQKIQNRGRIVVGIQYDAKPFGFVDKDGTLKGVDVDVAREVAKRIFGSPSKVEFKQVTPSTRIQAITTGDVDMVIATMSITPQRLQIIDFSTPYYMAGQAIVVPTNSKITSVNSLNNKRVIVVLGTTGERNLRYFAPSSIMQGYMNYQDAFRAFKLGHTDAMTSDDALLLGFVMDNKGYKILPKRLTEEPYGIAFEKSDNALALKNNLNRIIDDMRSDGTLNKIEDKWGIKKKLN